MIFTFIVEPSTKVIKGSVGFSVVRTESGRFSGVKPLSWLALEVAALQRDSAQAAAVKRVLLDGTLLSAAERRGSSPVLYHWLRRFGFACKVSPTPWLHATRITFQRTGNRWTPKASFPRLHLKRDSTRVVERRFSPFLLPE